MPPRNYSPQSFGATLASFRSAANPRLTQRALANPALGLSSSYLAMLEREDRQSKGQKLTREQIWYLIRRLGIWPPVTDDFLTKAGHSTDRSDDEERYIQENMEFTELWVFARQVVDTTEKWTEVVRKNLNRGIRYIYFTEESGEIYVQNLLDRLLKGGLSEEFLEKNLECYSLPSQMFVTNFAIYVRPKPASHYGCGTKLEEGMAESFFTMKGSETTRLHELLRGLQQHCLGNKVIKLDPMTRFFPNSRSTQQANFTSFTPTSK